MRPIELTEGQLIVRQMAEDHFDRMKSEYRDGASLSQLMDCDLYLRELQKDAILNRADIEFFSTIHRLASSQFKHLVLRR